MEELLLFLSPCQVKGISYSEQDLHKPKRFATFSFGLKKKKKKYEDNISKSTFGLHVPEPEDSSQSSVSNRSNCPQSPSTMTSLELIVSSDRF